MKTSSPFLVQDLDDASRTRGLADTDLHALHAVTDWVKTFVAMPNIDLGRGGPVCPFTAGRWSAIRFGGHQSGSPIAAWRMSSSS